MGGGRRESRWEEGEGGLGGRRGKGGGGLGGRRGKGDMSSHAE